MKTQEPELQVFHLLDAGMKRAKSVKQIIQVPFRVMKRWLVEDVGIVIGQKGFNEAIKNLRYAPNAYAVMMVRRSLGLDPGDIASRISEETLENVGYGIVQADPNPSGDITVKVIKISTPPKGSTKRKKAKP